MSERPLTVAITGLNATDNPGPGVSVIRSIRLDPRFDGRIIGLAYDVMEPGIYARDIVDEVFLIPYPSEGMEALERRLSYIHEQVHLDAIIPTLDSELPSFIALEPTLNRLGIGTFLPTREQFDVRSKARLAAMGADLGVEVPTSRTLTNVADLYTIHTDIPYPFVVKGLYYGASIVRSVDEAVEKFHRMAANWGLPIIVQRFIEGDEFDVVAVGDGEGGLVGALPMKKTTITDKGKGWAGIAIKDPTLIELTETLISGLRWRGPCEVEVVKDREGSYHLLEINPRFPAWVFLSAGAGLNLPSAVVRLAAGERVDPLRDYRVGTMFVRISLDLIGDLSDFQQLTTGGELLAAKGARP